MLDRRPTWGGRRRNHISIALEPLDDRATAQLVRALAEGASDELVDAIVARAEGNPFFAGEIVSAVVERVKSFKDPAQVQEALARLPDTVQATVLARLDELPDDEREVLRVGSVFGRTFRPQGVAALVDRVGLEGASLADVCARLSERDLVRPTGADGYTFRHILIREVAYSTLPRSTRARLHGAAGRWLEQRAAVGEEALAELVAYHFREAASIATAMELEHAAELRDSARVWLVRASQMARSGAASVEARQHASDALQFGREEDWPELYELLGDVEIGGSPMIVAYATALDHADRLGRSDDEKLRLLSKQLMIEMRSQGSVASRMTDARLSSLRGLGGSLLERSADPLARAWFLAADSFYPFWICSASGQHDELLAVAERSASQALELARKLDDANLQSAALDALGSLAGHRWDWRRSMEFGHERIAMGSRLALAEQIDAYAMTTRSAVLAGELSAADEASAAGLAMIQPGQALDMTLHLVAWRVVALLLLGKWTEAVSEAELAEKLWRQSGQPAAGYSLRGFDAGIIVCRARRDEAVHARLLAAVEQINGSFRVRGWMAIANNDLDEIPGTVTNDDGLVEEFAFEYATMAMSLLSDVLHAAPRPQLEQALEQARAADTPLLEAEIRRSLALSGDDLPGLKAALSIFDRCGARPNAARVKCEIALLDGDGAAFEAGLHDLESIGDVVQAERYSKRWSSRGR